MTLGPTDFQCHAIRLHKDSSKSLERLLIVYALQTTSYWKTVLQICKSWKDAEEYNEKKSFVFLMWMSLYQDGRHVFLNIHQLLQSSWSKCFEQTRSVVAPLNQLNRVELCLQPRRLHIPQMGHYGETLRENFENFHGLARMSFQDKCLICIIIATC